MNKLKIILMCTVAFLFATACNSDKFVLDGYLKGVADQDVYLCVNSMNQELIPLDTARMKNGHFRFKGKMDHSDYRFITFQDLAGEIQLYIDNSKMELTGDFARLDSVKVTGSPAMDYFTSFFEEENRNNLYMNGQIAAFRSAQQAEDTAAMKKIMRETVAFSEAYARKILEKANEHPNELVSLSVVAKWIGYLNPDKFAEYYEKVPDYVKNNFRMGDFDEYLQKNVVGLSKGHPAPYLSLVKMGSVTDSVTSESVRNKLTALYVTATDEVPMNDQMYALLHKAKEKGANVILVFISADQNPPAGIDEYLKNHGLTDFEATWGKGNFLQTYLSPSPRVFFIGKDGKFIGTALNPGEAEAIVNGL